MGTSPGNTDSAKNLDVVLTQTPSLDSMERLLDTAASELGVYFSHITNLSAKRYPGNRHWHFKRDAKERGCLDVTYWPDGPAMWVTMRNSEPEWVHDIGTELGALVERMHRSTGPEATDGPLRM